MKVLIWIGCCLIPIIVNTTFLEMGIRLGGIPTGLLYGGSIYLANKLCKKWDMRRKTNNIVETQNDESIVSETHKEQGKRQAPIFLTKLRSFMVEQRRLFFILTIISSVLIIASFIVCFVSDTFYSNILDHYLETSETISASPLIKRYGCGLDSCHYCKGFYSLSNSGIYGTGTLRLMSDILDILVLCLNGFVILTVTCLTLFIISLVLKRKEIANKE